MLRFAKQSERDEDDRGAPRQDPPRAIGMSLIKQPMPEPLEIAAQGTPNPNATKFTLNRVVATQGKTYRDASSAEVEWVKRLLGIAGVTQVFALNNFISITKTPEADWTVIGPQIEQVLGQAFA